MRWLCLVALRRAEVLERAEPASKMRTLLAGPFNEIDTPKV